MPTEHKYPHYLKDIEEDPTVFCGLVRFSKADCIDFAKNYDPLGIHTDPETAAASRFDGIIASGYLMLLISVRKLVEEARQHRAVIAGIGMDNVSWHEPVRSGDTISVKTTIIETKRSESNPDAGVLREEITVTNQFNSEWVS